MASRLIRLEDGSLVEVQVSEQEAQPIAGGLAERVNSSFDAIRPLLKSIARPLAETWRELNREVEMEQAEVELGISFEAGGHVYVASATASSTLKVKLILRPSIPS